jgi:hypothetical protein
MARNGGQNAGAQARQQQSQQQTPDPVQPDPGGTANTPNSDTHEQLTTAGLSAGSTLQASGLSPDDPHYGAGANLPAAAATPAPKEAQHEVAKRANEHVEPTAFLVTGLKPKVGAAGVVVLDLETPDGKMGGTLDMPAEEAGGHAIVNGKLVYLYPDGSYSVPNLPPMQVARPTGPATTNGAPAPRTPASAELDVLDTTATISYPKREHTIIVNGEEVTYLFEQGKPRRMPAAHAMKFVKYPAFQVTDPATGKRFEPIADPSQRQVSIAALAPNQVIASLDELTPKALLHRCHTMNGGERYGANSDPREMIAFIIAATAPQQAEGGADEMDADQLAKMFS